MFISRIEICMVYSPLMFNDWFLAFRHKIIMIIIITIILRIIPTPQVPGISHLPGKFGCETVRLLLAKRWHPPACQHNAGQLES